MQMQIYRAKAEISGTRDDYRAAIEAGRTALLLYPGDPRGLIALADCLAEAGTATGSDDWLEQAITNYETALEVDDKRLAWEELRRLRPEEKAAIHTRIEQLRKLLEADTE
jgi:tetratricopeptide (TPR) repeat protein